MRLLAQLAVLAEEGDGRPGDMIVFPVPVSSGSLTDLDRDPTLVVERIGPDVVRIRRRSSG